MTRRLTALLLLLLLALAGCSQILEPVEEPAGGQEGEEPAAAATPAVAWSGAAVFDLGTEVPDENLVAIDENNFPDTTFRSYVAENFDTNQDNQLSVAEGPSENFV